MIKPTVAEHPSRFDHLSREIGRAFQLKEIDKLTNKHANMLLFMVDTVMSHLEFAKGNWSPDFDSKERLNLVWDKDKNMAIIDLNLTIVDHKFVMRVGTTEAPRNNDDDTWSLYLFGDLFGIVNMSTDDPFEKLAEKLPGFVLKRLKQDVAAMKL